MRHPAGQSWFVIQKNTGLLGISVLAPPCLTLYTDPAIPALEQSREPVRDAVVQPERGRVAQVCISPGLIIQLGTLGLERRETWATRQVSVQNQDANLGRQAKHDERGWMPKNYPSLQRRDKCFLLTSPLSKNTPKTLSRVNLRDLESKFGGSFSE